MKSTFKENIFTDGLKSNPRFFNKFQQVDFIVKVLHMFPELNNVIHKEDEFIVEWDYQVNDHLFLHKSKKFKETRAICYLSSDKFSYKTHLPFIISSLKEAWVEYEI